MKYNPFEEVEPLEPLDVQAAFAASIHRSMMWDLLGPHKMWNDSEKYGQCPASPDVLTAEYEDMMVRHNSLLPFGGSIPQLCFIAAESVSQIVMASDKRYAEISEEDRTKFRAQTVQMGSAITSSVIGHLIQSGLLHYGGHQ